jgi:hypothetical protein
VPPIPFTPPTPLMVTGLYVLMVAVAVDTGAGMLKALMSGTFHLSLVGNFLRTAVLPLVGPAMLLYLLAMAVPQVQSLALSFVGAATAKLLSDTAMKLGVNLGQVSAGVAGVTGLATGKLAATKAPSPPGSSG